MTFWLIRHAKTERDSRSGADYDRQLTSRGRADAARVGAWASRWAERPMAILCSGAARARETLDHLCVAWPALADVSPHVHDDLYLAPGETVVSYAEQRAAELAARGADGSIWVIGHNPGLTDAAEILSRATLNPLVTMGVAIIRDGSLSAWFAPRLFRPHATVE